MLQINRDELEQLSQRYHFTGEQHRRFSQYINLLESWNQHTNLVSAKDLERLVSRHLLESMQITRPTPIQEAQRILDIGSGGGFPGIPLAIMFPDKTVMMVESRNRKALFLKQVVEELKLENASVFHARVEGLSVNDLGGAVQVVTARAVAELAKLWDWSRPLLHSTGCLLAYKGGDITAEMQVLRKKSPVIKILPIPDLPVENERFFVQISNM